MECIATSLTKKKRQLHKSYLKIQLCLPLYNETSIHGSVGCRSTHFTRSDRAVNLRLISKRKGCNTKVYTILIVIRIYSIIIMTLFHSYYDLLIV